MKKFYLCIFFFRFDLPMYLRERKEEIKKNQSFKYDYISIFSRCQKPKQIIWDFEGTPGENSIQINELNLIDTSISPRKNVRK